MVRDRYLAVFLLEHDMLMVAETSQIKLNMTDVVFSAGQSKIKKVKEMRINSNKFLILASDLMLEVS